MCFAVFLGSWAPLSSKIGMFSSAASSAISGKSAVDYSTPSGKYSVRFYLLYLMVGFVFKPHVQVCKY